MRSRFAPAKTPKEIAADFRKRPRGRALIFEEFQEMTKEELANWWQAGMKDA